ncbi:hypothetical protein D9M70_524700 [compost metagenome]
MQDEVLVVDVRILIDVVHALSVERGGAALDAVDFVALFQQEFCEVGAVLAGDAGDQGFFLAHVSVLDQSIVNMRSTGTGPSVPVIAWLRSK